MTLLAYRLSILLHSGTKHSIANRIMNEEEQVSKISKIDILRSRETSCEYYSDNLMEQSFEKKLKSTHSHQKQTFTNLQPRQLPQFHRESPILPASAFLAWRHNRITQRSISSTVVSVSSETSKKSHPNLRANSFPSLRETSRSVPRRTVPTRTL